MPRMLLVLWPCIGFRMNHLYKKLLHQLVRNIHDKTWFRVNSYLDPRSFLTVIAGKKNTQHIKKQMNKQTNIDILLTS